MVASVGVMGLIFLGMTATNLSGAIIAVPLMAVFFGV